MQALPVHFRLLSQKINPSPERSTLAADLVGGLREWLKQHEFATIAPHTLLSGSYARHTAILRIKDVDCLLFLAAPALDRTPNAVLLELVKILATYPGAAVDVVGQRRSVRLLFEEDGLFLDIVPAIAHNGLNKPLHVPDRPQQEWILSHPLGYAHRLSDLNERSGEKAVRLIKMIKAWRDEHMKVRRPKSYVLEAMIVKAIETEQIVLDGECWPSILSQLFEHWRDKYQDLLDEGAGVPRVFDPQLGHLISAGWERSHFETFMRRVDDASRWAQWAVEATTEARAAEQWVKVFGQHWPAHEEVEDEAEKEATRAAPGKSAIASTGWVIGPTSALTLPTQETRFHGDD